MFLVKYVLILIQLMQFELSLSRVFGEKCCTNCLHAVNGHIQAPDHGELKLNKMSHNFHVFVIVTCV